MIRENALTEESLTVVIAPTLRQSSELLKKIRTFLRRAGVDTKSDPANRFSLVLPNRSRILALPADPDNIRGFSAVSLLIIDEAARVPDEVYDAALPFLAATDGQLWLMSTPNGKRGFFYREWTSADPNWLRIRSTAAHAPHLKQAFLDRQRANCEAGVYLEEYECQFRDAEGQIFAADDIDMAFSVDAGPIPSSHFIATGSSTDLWYFIGLDLGQRQDHSALAVLELHTRYTGFRDPVSYNLITESLLTLRQLERYPLHMPYSDLIWKVKDVLANPNIQKRHSIAVDATGVGGPFIDFLRDAGVRTRLLPVSITSGDAPSLRNGTHYVPKRDLFTNLQILIQSRQITISQHLPWGPRLRDELLSLRRHTGTNYETYGTARSGQHDDLVFALALAAWKAPTRLPKSRSGLDTGRQH
ncbi:MAG: hypothetical protein FJW39_34680 [Acidobacteria bacterium]|nr:hypothetical protein [Acidobacteriota bacterium]